MRRIPTFLFITLVLAAAIWFLLESPLFRVTMPEDFLSSIKQNPLDLTSTLPLVGELEIDGEKMYKRLENSWGVVYPHSGRVTVDYPQFARQIESLNDAIGEMSAQGSDQKYYRALRMLGDYRYYPRKVDGIRKPYSDVNPATKEETLIYALTRYNRAVALLHISDYQSKEGNETTSADYLRKALFDMRRAVGNFERLGARGLPNGDFGYWGDQAAAWDNVRLKPEDGDLPIKYAYANIGTIYLRIHDLDLKVPELNYGPDGYKEYPEIDLPYLESMLDRYRYGASEIGSSVAICLRRCLQKGKDNLEPSFYRLTHALQNLEAASRGMMEENNPRYYYLVASVLKRIARQYDPSSEERGRFFDQALGLFKSAEQSAQNDAFKVKILVEKLLMYMEKQRWEHVAEELQKVEDPRMFENCLFGKNEKYWPLLYAMALYSDISKANMDTVLARVEELSSSTYDLDEKIHEYKRTILHWYYSAFISQLKERIADLERAGKYSTVGAFFSKLRQSGWLEKMKNRSGYKYQLPVTERVQWNLKIRKDKNLADFFKYLPYGLAAFWGLYFLFFYFSHRKYAKQYIRTSYPILRAKGK